MTVLTSKEPLKRINVRLWRSDVEYLKEHHADNYNAQIRRIVSAWVTEHRSYEYAQKAREIPSPGAG